MSSSASSSGAQEVFTSIISGRKRRRLNTGLDSDQTETQDGGDDEHYATRVKDKRLQLSNPDRSRPISDDQRKKLKKRQARCDVHPTNKNGTEKTGQKEDKSKRRTRGKDIDTSTISYNALLPLSSMWQSYIVQFLSLLILDTQTNTLKPNAQYMTASGALKSNSIATIQSQIVKADLLASNISVIRSNNPANVGVHGIVAKETASTFLIAKQDTKFVTVPKRDTTFVIRIKLKESTLQVPIQGNAIANAFVTRATKKWKSRKTMNY
ncbi:unnamed protein product [Sympodiomycopsis kandeliae]